MAAERALRRRPQRALAARALSAPPAQRAPKAGNLPANGNRAKGGNPPGSGSKAKPGLARRRRKSLNKT